MAEEKTATYIKDLPWRGDARLYKLSEPVMIDDWYTDNEEPEYTEYVIVSAVDAMFSGPETYIFPAQEDGTATDMIEMRGSFRGSYDHQLALEGLGGFKIVS